MTQDATALMDTLDSLMKEGGERLPALFPWVSSLSAADRCAFAVGLLQAVQARNMAQLTELLEDWQSTAVADLRPSIQSADSFVRLNLLSSQP